MIINVCVSVLSSPFIPNQIDVSSIIDSPHSVIYFFRYVPVLYIRLLFELRIKLIISEITDHQEFAVLGLFDLTAKHVVLDH